MNNITCICLGVKDMERSIKFYRDGLGYKTDCRENSPSVCFFDTPGTKFELFPLEQLAKDIDGNNPIKGNGFSGITLAYNVEHKEDVETVIALVRKAGIKIVKEPQEVFWGGYSKGLKLANKYVKKTGNKNAQMYFSVDNPKEFAKYTNTKLLEVDGFFQKALKDCHGLKLSTKIYMYFADRWNRTLVVHLRFTE